MTSPTGDQETGQPPADQPPADQPPADQPPPVLEIVQLGEGGYLLAKIDPPAIEGRFSLESFEATSFQVTIEVIVNPPDEAAYCGARGTCCKRLVV
jgi:hypothetical protein